MTGRASQSPRILLLAGTCCLWACSTTTEHNLHSRADALQQWLKCVNQNTIPVHIKSVFERSKHENFRAPNCDGYRRDVLLSYPVHLENQVDKLLSEQEGKIAASRLVEMQRSRPQINVKGTLIETIEALHTMTHDGNL